MWSLVIFVYIIPLFQDRYNPIHEDGALGRIKNAFGRFKYSLWRGYKARLRSDYGTVYAAEYEHYKSDLEEIRNKMSGFLLLPFMLVLLPFLPLFGLAIVLFLRLFTLDDKPYTFSERLLLSCILLGALTFSTALIFVVNIFRYVYSEKDSRLPT